VLSALHFLTHVGISWIVADLARLTPRDRWVVVLAGALPDLDGIGILWSEHAYAAAHRAAAHSVFFAVLIVVLALLVANRPWAAGVLAAVSFHLHLLLDVIGTGGLPIRYLWPLTEREWSYDGHWVLASWPNAAVMTATALGVVVIEWRRRRSTSLRESPR
jgi:membrane-bound metal-dependent hydrolase YbcI (DUF457 family)